MTYADYANKLALLANIPNKTESLLKVAGVIVFNMNANKTEYMCFKQKQTISALNDKPLKLVDTFTYLGNNSLFTESTVNMRFAKAYIDRLSIIWKSDQSEKTRFLPNCSCVHTTISMHYMDINQMYREKTLCELHKNAACCREQILEAASHKTAALQPLAIHFTNYSSKTNKTCGALLEKPGRIHKRHYLMDSSTWLR